MAGIYTFTPNPCLDKSISVPVLLPDKKLHCTIDQVQPEGGGINVARVLKRLDLSAIAVLPAGGPTGDRLRQLLDDEGVDSLLVPAVHSTRENIILTESATQRQFRLGMPGEPLTHPEWEQCLDVLAHAGGMEYLVVSGSLPEGAPTDLFHRIASIVQHQHARLIVDSAGSSLQAALQAGVYLVKPNLSELAGLYGKTALNESQALEAARRLVDKGQANIVVVSMDARGALLVTVDECYRAVPPVIKPRSSVGAGDSMVGGLVYALSKGFSLRDVLRRGIACGSAAIMNPGTTLCRPSDVLAIEAEVQLFPLLLPSLAPGGGATITAV
ncbi:1-phosphofructokinase family hexose kinase [Paraflavitalea pollutisoli]|uniref:1-phosphofructokinase family hexose kinase n=1 Tax=Paraflavitalea pollutisoli TaxID=3034143 RepID=UPI0023EB5F3F|nr:1-phosphofructokinase family hexose kinase [Paraflavitalea sp. H1-2-19X]